MKRSILISLMSISVAGLMVGSITFAKFSAVQTPSATFQSAQLSMSIIGPDGTTVIDSKSFPLALGLQSFGLLVPGWKAGPANITVKNTGNTPGNLTFYLSSVDNNDLASQLTLTVGTTTHTLAEWSTVANTLALGPVSGNSGMQVPISMGFPDADDITNNRAQNQSVTATAQFKLTQPST
jgi:hypothetical protein